MQSFFVALSLTVAFGLSACCPASAPTQPTAPEPAPAAPEPPRATPPTPADDPPPASARCAEPPQIVCCQALTPECEACQSDAARRLEDFETRCSPASDLAPVPETFDCTQPPPLVACCRALLPRCTACAERNRAVEGAWRAACAKLEPGEGAP